MSIYEHRIDKYHRRARQVKFGLFTSNYFNKFYGNKIVLNCFFFKYLNFLPSYRIIPLPVVSISRKISSTSSSVNCSPKLVIKYLKKKDISESFV